MYDSFENNNNYDYNNIIIIIIIYHGPRERARGIDCRGAARGRKVVANVTGRARARAREYTRHLYNVFAGTQCDGMKKKNYFNMGIHLYNTLSRRYMRVSQRAYTP